MGLINLVKPCHLLLLLSVFFFLSVYPLPQQLWLELKHHLYISTQFFLIFLVFLKA